MDAKIDNLNRSLKTYDRYLYAERASSSEMIGIYRMSYRWETYDWNGSHLSVSRPMPDPVMFLTDNWKITGKPVDWGTEPVMNRIREFDAWNHDDIIDEVIAERETLKNNKAREFRNNLRASAADLRKEFAEAVNDINTSTIDMVDSRRKKDGTRK